MAASEAVSGAPGLARKAARIAAPLWTAGIFAACLWPGKALPHSSIPFIDKWTHFVLFGGFAVLWLIAYPSRSWPRLAGMLGLATALGIFIECLQMALPSLGRSGELMDAVSDAVGGALGTALFYVAGIRRRS